MHWSSIHAKPTAMKRFFTALLVLITWDVKAQSVCPLNLGFDNGDFLNWQCYTGTTTSINCDSNVVSLTPSPPVMNRHTVLPPNNLTDAFGNFPLTPDNSPVARLGYYGQAGAQVEALSYTLTVPTGTADFSLNFKFALVLQSPVHCDKSQSHFSAKIFDVTAGHYLNCYSVEQFGGSPEAGFFLSPNNTQGTVYYKPWTEVAIPLSGYGGHTLRLEFVNADCTPAGHWAYCYLDLPNNCNSIVKGSTFCPGSPATIAGPMGYAKYAWWNSSFTQKLDTTKNLTLTPPPSTATVLALDLISPAGPACRDTVFVTVKPNPVIVANAGADAIKCTGNASVNIGSPATTGYAYSWNPPIALNFSNIAQPLAAPVATTSYVLTVTDIATGCTQKDTMTVFVNAPASAFNVNLDNQCLAGNNFVFTTANSFSGSTYAWNFGDGSTSVSQNPSHSFGSNGVYIVKLKVSTLSGCLDSTTKTITVGSLSIPVASLNGSILQSSFATGNQWYLNGVLLPGATGNTYLPVTSGNYTVIATINGCSSAPSNTVAFTITALTDLERQWKLSILPNPVHNQLLVQFNGVNKLDLTIYDLAGRLMLAWANINSATTLDLGGFAPGSYVISLKDSRTGLEYRRRIVKQ